MSYSLDANVLLYASDETNPWHRPAKDFLADCLAKSELLCLAWPTIMAYLRIATHPSIFEKPLTPAEAEQNIQALLDLPHVRALAEEEGFWETYRTVTAELPVRGNLVPDAHVAALLRHHEIATLYTKDKDFRKFDFLTPVDPFPGAPKEEPPKEGRPEGER